MARKRFGSEFKARVALEAIRGEKTAARIPPQYGVHAPQIGTRKKRVRERLVEAFERGAGCASAREIEAHEDRLCRQVGKLQVELDWLQKRSRTLGLL